MCDFDDPKDVKIYTIFANEAAALEAANPTLPTVPSMRHLSECAIWVYPEIGCTCRNDFPECTS